MKLKKKLIRKPDMNDMEIEQLTDLMYKMFEYDPKKRISIKKCLAHQWFENRNRK